MAEKHVRVYSTPTCPWCRKVKEWLDSKQIQYQEFDVTKDQTAREEMVKTTHQMSVPVTIIDGDYLVGFNEKSFREKLGIN